MKHHLPKIREITQLGSLFELVSPTLNYGIIQFLLPRACVAGETKKGTTHLSCNVLVLLLCDRVTQRDWRRIDKITFPLGDLQMNPMIRICLYIEIAISILYSRVLVRGEGMVGVMRGRGILEPSPLDPLQILELAVDFCI